MATIFINTCQNMYKKEVKVCSHTINSYVPIGKLLRCALEKNQRKCEKKPAHAKETIT